MKKMSPDEIRKDFELAMVFGIDGIPQYAGCIKRLPNDEYKDIQVQAAYVGYVRAMTTQNNMIDRLDPQREITNGMRTQFRELAGREDIGDDLMRAAVQVFAGSPVSR